MLNFSTSLQGKLMDILEAFSIVTNSGLIEIDNKIQNYQYSFR